jgi:exodeoxyribonuclease-3
MRLQHLIELLQNDKPDIVLLQETKCENEKFPTNALGDLGYNVYIHGQKSYNGVAILSKFRADDGAEDIKYSFYGNPIAEQARFLEITAMTSIGFCRIISLYAPNGGEVDSDKFESKLKFYDALTAYLEGIKSFDEKLIIGGDFNIAPFDIDVYNPKKLLNTTCFTLAEKEKMRILLNTGFDDLYRVHNINKQEFSWWDYRAGSFEQNKGMRIDTLLATSNVVEMLDKCYIDYNMRSKQKASDHSPVIAELINEDAFKEKE